MREWQQGVLDMVRTEGADKRTTARFLAFGVNGLSVALMVVVFAHTGGITGAEAGIAGGSAVLGQKLLEAVFGDQAVRTLAERARADLDRRVGDADGCRAGALPRAGGRPRDRPGGPRPVRDAARRVDDQRFASQSRVSTATTPNRVGVPRTERSSEGDDDVLAGRGQEAGLPDH